MSGYHSRNDTYWTALLKETLTDQAQFVHIVQNMAISI